MQGPREGFEILDFALRYILEVKGGRSGDGWVAEVKEGLKDGGIERCIDRRRMDGLKDGLIDEGWID